LDYETLVKRLPASSLETVSNKLADFILTSKNDEKMPAALANSILLQWRNDLLKSEHGLAALLEAAVLLEPEKTIGFFTELQMTDIAEEIKATVQP
jgi:hypothetical protein